jgi:plastocyanin
MKRRLLVPAAALSALAGLTFTVAACGGGGGTAKPAPTIPAGALQVDAVAGLKFDKSEYTATAGTVTIAYLNKDSQRHTLVVKDAAGVLIGDKLEVVRSNDLSTGSYQLAPGTYTVYCDVPGHGSMKATLVVS